MEPASRHGHTLFFFSAGLVLIVSILYIVWIRGDWSQNSGQYSFFFPSSAQNDSYGPHVSNVTYSLPAQSGDTATEQDGQTEPMGWQAVYISPSYWPPRISTSDEEWSCRETDPTTPDARGAETKRETISGQIYCVSKITEGAAGSIYTNYKFKTQKNDALVVVELATQSPQCTNYPEPERGACEEERKNFEIGPLIHAIVENTSI